MEKPKLVELMPAQGSKSIFVEVIDVEGEKGVVQAGPKTFENMLKEIKPFCELIISNFRELSTRPTSASAEFGLKVSGEGNLFIAKASAEATLKVTLNWT
jgi:Trypsin-co-occurring domain 1